MYHTLVNPRHLAANDKPLRFGMCPQNCKCRVITIFFFLCFDNSYNKLIVRFLSHGRCQATSNNPNPKPNKTEKLGEAPKIEPNFGIDNVQHEKHRAEETSKEYVSGRWHDCKILYGRLCIDRVSTLYFIGKCNREGAIEFVYQIYCS